MTTNTFISGVKSVTTLSWKGREGWDTEAECRWLNDADDRVLGVFLWDDALGHVHVLNSLQRSGQALKASGFWWWPGELLWAWDEPVPQRTRVTPQCRIVDCLCLIQPDRPAIWLVCTQGNCGRNRSWPTSHLCILRNFKILLQVCRKEIKLPVVPCNKRVASGHWLPGEIKSIISSLHVHTEPNLSLFIPY